MLEHDYEPVPGLPQVLPGSEYILWQAKPRFAGLAAGTFHIRMIAGYFLVLIAISVVSRVSGGETIGTALAGNLGLAVLAAIALGLLAGYARMVAKTSLFTITTRRVIVRTGIAVPVTINLPFNRINSVDLRTRNDGNGDLSLLTERGSRASYALLWPFVRPFRTLRVTPVLRGIDDAAATAQLLADALAADARARAETVEEPEAAPSGAEALRDGQSRDGSWRSWLAYPTLPLAAATSLVVISLITVGWSRISPPALSPMENVPALSSIELYFEDREDGSVVVIDAVDDRVLDVLAPGTNGFVRGTLRSLARARRAIDAGSEQPFRLTRTRAGQLLLMDTVSGREIDLWAFGRTNAEAFNRYLETQSSESASTAIDTTESNGGANMTAVASTNQEPRP